MRERAFEEFYARDYARLVAAIGLAIGEPDVARDAVDEALARAWEHSRRIDIDCLAAWVRVVAMNIARSGFRRRTAERRATERFVARANAALTHENSAEVVDVARALAALSSRQREVMVLHYFLDVSVRDIAHELRMTEGGVKACLHRARTAMADELRPAEVS